MNDIPLSLYIHIPWCARKCPYCDFNSHEADGEIPEAAYVDMLTRDLHTELDRYHEQRPIHSIFIGGGTPSLFSARAMKKLLDRVRDRVELEADAEVTLEANPGTLEDSVAHFAAYHDAGINRLSLGAQSFDDTCLAALGRIHSARQIGEAFSAARQAGITRINLDLMHGLPGQTAADATIDLTHAVELGPEHISWYQLTIEPNTVFYRHPPSLPDEDVLSGIYEHGSVYLGAQGYRRYEVSAFCRPGEESRHNLNYWRFGDYLGIGAGAHGKITSGGHIERIRKTRLPEDYLRAPKARRESVSPGELPLEFLMNALRLPEGFNLDLFESRTGLAAETLSEFIGEAARRELILVDERHIRPTSRGLDYLNDLLLLADGNIVARG